MRRIGSWVASAGLAVGGVALGWGAAVVAAAPASAGESGNVCVHDYASGVSCEATDVEFVALELDTIFEDCGADGTAVVTLDAVLFANGADRYDVGMFVALNGDSAESGGNCYHDYLAPPLTTSPTYGDDYSNGVPDIWDGPWADLEPFAQPPDSCGDMQGNTEAIKTIETATSPLTIDCVDTNQDGTVDVSVCTSWSNGTSSSCSVVWEAFPATGARCNCTRLEVLPEPGAPLSLACGAALAAALASRRRSA